MSESKPKTRFEFTPVEDVGYDFRFSLFTEDNQEAKLTTILSQSWSLEDIQTAIGHLKASLVSELARKGYDENGKKKSDGLSQGKIPVGRGTYGGIYL